MTGPRFTVCDATRVDAGLSEPELFLRYFGLGGMLDAAEIHASLSDATPMGDHDHDVLAHALNERFTELGRNHPVVYAGSSR